MNNVTIKKEKNTINISCDYDNTLYNIMKSYKGKFDKKERYWKFPISVFENIKKDIEKKKYKVYVMIEQNGSVIIENIFDDLDVVSVYGRACKVCKRVEFIGRSGICTRCLNK